MSQITDQIKDRVDIIEVIREYAPELKKTGANWKARCPFHQEKTASFLASPEKGIWHCFGCGKGGDVFGFIREIEGIEFGDALRLLAKRAGIKLEKQDKAKESERSRTLDALKLAASWFHQALLSAKSAEQARAYVKERKISDKASDEWMIGFAPDQWESVSIYLRSRSFRDDEISRAGLSSRNERGGSYDRFRNRLMFPISDVHGSVVGFTARKMREEDIGGKYINTPETIVYHKSSVLYGLHFAKQAIREQDLAIVVEGNMDCLSSHQAGIKNVVASSGTALTEEQIRLIKRFTKNIALGFDPDSAGQEALARAMEAAWREEMSVKIICLSQGKDPDNLIKQNPDLWREAISKALDFMGWLFSREENKHDLKTAQGKRDAAKTILSWIARLGDPIMETHYLQKLSAKINVDENILRSIIAKKMPKRGIQNPGAIANSNDKKSSQESSLEEKMNIRLLALLIADKKTEPKPNHALYKYLDALYDFDTSAVPENLHQKAREAIMLSEEIKDQENEEEREKERDSLYKRISEYAAKKESIDFKAKIQDAEKAGDKVKVEEYMEEWKNIRKSQIPNYK